MEPYTLRYDAARNLVEATFHGRWSLAEAERWRRDADKLQAGLRPGYQMLVDMTDHPAQSQEVKAVHDASMAETIGHGPKKIVAIVASTVLALQMKRSSQAAGGSQLFEFVTTKEEASKALAG